MISGFAEWMHLVRECNACGSVSFVFVAFCFVFLLLLLSWFCYISAVHSNGTITINKSAAVTQTVNIRRVTPCFD